MSTTTHPELITQRSDNNRENAIYDSEIARWEQLIHDVPGAPELFAYEYNLGLALLARHSNVSNIREDLELGLQHMEKGLDLTPPGHAMKADIADSLADIELGLHLQTGDTQILQKAFAHFQQALDLTPHTDAKHLKRMQNLALMHIDRFQKLGDCADLDQAIKYAREIVDDHLVQETSAKLSWLKKAVALYYERFKKLDELDDIENILEYWRQVLDIIPKDHPERVPQVVAIAELHEIRYKRQNNSHDLDLMIQYGHAVVELTPVDDPARFQHLFALATYYASRYERLGEPESLNNALQHAHEALNLTPTSHPGHALVLVYIAGLYTEKYCQLGSLNELEKGLTFGEKALALGLGNSSRKADHLRVLSVIYGKRYQHQGRISDLNTAVQYGGEALNLIADDKFQRASCLHNLGHQYLQKYQRWNQVEDLNYAVKYGGEAVDLVPDTEFHKPGILHDYAFSCLVYYRRLDDQKYLSAALEHGFKALYLCAERHPMKSRCLQNLSNSYAAKYLGLNDVSDLVEAMKHAEAAMECLPPQHPDKAACLYNICRLYQYQYQRYSNLEDLRVALQSVQNALKTIPDTAIDRPRYLAALAITYNYLFHRLGDFSDLEQAIQYTEAALKLLPESHAERPEYLQNLSHMYQDKYRWLRDPKDVGSAVRYSQEALDSTPEGHIQKNDRLFNLGLSHSFRYRKLHDPKDLELSWNYVERALNFLPSSNLKQSQWLQTAAGIHKDFSRTWFDPDDPSITEIDENSPSMMKYWNHLSVAMEYQEQALKALPPKHSTTAKHLQALAHSMMEQYPRLQDTNMLTEIRTKLSLSFGLVTGEPETSWNIALIWAVFAHKYDRPSLRAAVSFAFQLLPNLLWMGHSIPTRHNAIRRLDIPFAVSISVRLCIDETDLRPLVANIEQGVATIFQQILQLRPDIEKLEKKQAEQLEEVSGRLQHTARAEEITPQENLNLLEAVLQRDKLVQEIRKKPGLEYFLRPKPYHELCNAAVHGPIVILSSHEVLCDGIILLNSTKPPIHLPLRVKLEEIHRHQKQLQGVLSSVSSRMRGESNSTRLFGNREGYSNKSSSEIFVDMLSWLRAEIVGPVLEMLAKHNIHGGRLWWLPSGAFVGLPLHACSIDAPFVHSYTPTIGLLLEALKKPASPGPRRISVIAVTQTDSKGRNYLANVKTELKTIRSIVPCGELKCLQDQTATVEAVKSELEHCSWLHLACHGKQDWFDATKSRLLLYGGDLKLETILPMPMTTANVVFFSACETAMGDSTLVNESFHLAGGFLAAGFRGAVGTLWAMDDCDGPTVAKHFYSYLFRDGRDPKAGDAAEALNFSVKKLRESGVAYERWIPFIHMGV